LCNIDFVVGNTSIVGTGNIAKGNDDVVARGTDSQLSWNGVITDLVVSIGGIHTGKVVNEEAADSDSSGTSRKDGNNRWVSRVGKVIVHGGNGVSGTGSISVQANKVWDTNANKSRIGTAIGVEPEYIVDESEGGNIGNFLIVEQVQDKGGSTNGVSIGCDTGKSELSGCNNKLTGGTSSSLDKGNTTNLRTKVNSVSHSRQVSGQADHSTISTSNIDEVGIINGSTSNRTATSNSNTIQHSTITETYSVESGSISNKGQVILVLLEGGNSNSRVQLELACSNTS
jgi:hypothetical protein